MSDAVDGAMTSTRASQVARRIGYGIDADRAEERRVQRMTPPANTSKEAVALRKAALAFAGVPDTGDFHDAAGMRANRNLLRAAMAYAPIAERAEKKESFRRADEEREANPVVLRIQSTSEVKAASWIERYFLRDKLGRYRERKDIPGNGQYAPGDNEILAWFRSMGVTHVEVARGWHERVKPDTYPLAKFARIMRRVSGEYK